MGIPGSPTHTVPWDDERAPWLAFLPILATLLYYVLPPSVRGETLVQCFPQVIAYAAFICWMFQNTHVLERLGLSPSRISAGLTVGALVGLFLGTVNSFVIIRLVPWLGHDISFLKDTPHAKLPVLIMVPWFIALIALCVELNFRGFLLGRVLASWNSFGKAGRLGPCVAVGVSALAFAFDPFMVTTFKHLHWIAVWDGLIWGSIWITLRNLYATVMAHAVEVIILYSVVRAILMSS
jgi:hypothetical protein